MRGVFARVYEKDNGYQVRFLNPTTKNNYWGAYDTLEKALYRAFEIDFEFHLNNPGNLPKGITLDKVNRRFRFHVSVDNNTKVHILSDKSLEKLILARKHLMMNLMGLL